MNRRTRAKGKMHPRNDEGRVVNHAMCAMATQTMTSWTIAKTDASERAGKPSGKRTRAYVYEHLCSCIYRSMSKVGERMEGKYRKLDGVRELDDATSSLRMFVSCLDSDV